jgi:hypothetical protein
MTNNEKGTDTPTDHEIFSTTEPPFETNALRRELAAFLNQTITMPDTQEEKRLGSIKYGVYAFYDYDNEPIYVGQTRESLGTRIRRHLTNQRTDAVAMNVLDPYEVYAILAWPICELEGRDARDDEVKEHLNALEYQVFSDALEQSQFGAVLNEKAPPPVATPVPVPQEYRGVIVPSEVEELRRHPDVRIARRALTLARLAQVISERQVQAGLRNTLLTQAKRLEWLANRRYEHFSDSE